MVCSYSSILLISSYEIYITYTLPAIIPCILWAAVKIGEFTITDKETGEFTTSLKRFKLLGYFAIRYLLYNFHVCYSL